MIPKHADPMKKAEFITLMDAMRECGWSDTSVLAMASGIPRASVRSMLRTLERWGYAECRLGRQRINLWRLKARRSGPRTKPWKPAQSPRRT